jgi:hypothetical protein
MRRPPTLAAVAAATGVAGFAAAAAWPSPSPDPARAGVGDPPPALVEAAQRSSVVVVTPSLDVVLVRRPDGRWLVTARSPDPPPGEVR